ncbi:universal stress protein [Halolamina sp.]|jgi:nucleotide-binding universal stress UspA family protein|uniref:universal stress protein n=1 Tax=Halolamina sp. TaxID=1940283 RepID=UPI000223BA1C|nr:UspA domain-containing protein [halophilic archaeon DL31]
MTEHTTILVPIRYPLTDQSTQTLAAAGRLAHDHTPADLRVLHVNLYQTGDDTQTTELTRAISSTLDGVEASVITRQGFLVEEVILEEASQIDADIVVVGTNQQATWRRLLRRLLQNDPNVGTFLRDHTTKDTDIMEVDTAAETPAVEPV